MALETFPRGDYTDLADPVGPAARNRQGGQEEGSTQ